MMEGDDFLNRQLVRPYNREAALLYAKEWSFKRNPAFYDFSDIGGDCTNFISQCVYAGSKIMNYNPYSGWYYNSPSSRSASWTGVNFFYEFIVNNKGPGPFATEVPSQELLIPGDVIQFGDDTQGWHHSLLVLTTGRSYEDVLIAAHTYDAYGRALSTYIFTKIRFLHIEGVRHL